MSQYNIAFFRSKSSLHCTHIGLFYSHIELFCSHMSLNCSKSSLHYSHMSLHRSHIVLNYSHISLHYLHLAAFLSGILNTALPLMLNLFQHLSYHVNNSVCYINKSSKPLPAVPSHIEVCNFNENNQQFTTVNADAKSIANILKN